MPAVLTFASIRGATEDEQQCYEALEFQPTCPVRGTTSPQPLNQSSISSFQSTCPVRGTTMNKRGLEKRGKLFQSTCPVRGTTRRLRLRRRLRRNFNPRAPYGARRGFKRVLVVAPNFNPRAPYGARPDRSILVRRYPHISIHVPRTGHDQTGAYLLGDTLTFQSTCPVRGTTSRR